MTTHNFQGIAWALLATGLFAVVAAMAKVAVEHYHVLQILFFRQVVVFLSALPAISTAFPGSLKTDFPKIHALRLFGAFIALSCGIWAVAELPLTTAITLGFAQVFFVALLATSFLSEKIGSHRSAAVVIGFIGVVIVMRPGVDGIFNVHSLIPIAAALGAAIAIVSVRKLSQTESTATILVYQAVFVGVLAAIPLYWLWVTPDAKGLVLLSTMGILACIGQWVGVKALRLGEASVVGNIEYVKLIYAAILGYIFFNEIPDQYTIIGALVILVSSLYLGYRERAEKNASKK